MVPTTRTPIHYRTSLEPEVLGKQKIQILGQKLVGALANLGGQKIDDCSPDSIGSKIFESTENVSDVGAREITKSMHFISGNSFFLSTSLDKEEVGSIMSLFNTRDTEELTLDSKTITDDGGVETILQPTESFTSTSEVVNDISTNSKERVTTVQSPSFDNYKRKIRFSKFKRHKDSHVKLMINRSYFALPSMTSKIIDERNRALFERLTPVFNNSIIDKIFDGKESLNSSTDVNENLKVRDTFLNSSEDFEEQSDQNTKRVEKIPEDGVKTCIDPLTNKLYQVDFERKTIKQINYEDLKIIDINHYGNFNIQETQSLDKTTNNQENRMTDTKNQLSRSISTNNTSSTEMSKSKKLLHSIKSSISKNRIFVRNKSVRGNLQRYMPMFKSYVNKHMGVHTTHPEPFRSRKFLNSLPKFYQVKSPIVRAENDEQSSVSSLKSVNLFNSHSALSTVEQNNISRSHPPGNLNKENGRSKKAKKTTSILQLHKGSDFDILHGINKPEKQKSLKRHKVSRIQNLRSRKTSLISPNKGVTSELHRCKNKTHNKKKVQNNLESRSHTTRSITTKSNLNASKTNHRGHKPLHNENVNSCASSSSLAPNRISQHHLSPTGLDRSSHKKLGRFRNAKVSPKSHNAKIIPSSMPKTNQHQGIHRDVSKSVSKDKGSRTLLPIPKRPVQQNTILHTKSQSHKIPMDDPLHSRRRLATTSTKKSSPKKRFSSTNVKYTEKQNDNTMGCLSVISNPSPRIVNKADNESLMGPYSSLSKKRKFKSRTRSFVSFHKSPHLNQTVGKCCTKRKSRRSKFLESQLEDSSSDINVKKTLRSTISLNNVSFRKTDLKQNSTSPLFNTEENVVLDDSIFFTYREPIIRSNMYSEHKFESASRAFPLTVNSLYFSIDRHKGINYISDICIDKLLSPSKSVIIKEINDEKDDIFHLPPQKTVSKAHPPITKCKIPTRRKVRKVREHEKAKGAEMSSIIEKNNNSTLLPSVADMTDRNNVNQVSVKKVIESKHFGRGENGSSSTTIDSKSITLKILDEKCKGNVLTLEETNINKKRRLGEYEKKIESTPEESNTESKRDGIKEVQELTPMKIDQVSENNESSFPEKNENFKNNAETEISQELAPTYRSILKKGTKDWTNIAFPASDTLPPESHTTREVKTLNDSKKNTLTVHSSEDLQQDRNWPMKSKLPIKSHKDPFFITDSSLEELMKTDYLNTGKPYNFFIHSAPATVLSDSNVSILSDKKTTPFIQEITSNTDAVRRFLLSKPSNLHRRHFGCHGDEVSSSINPTVISNSNVSTNKDSGQVLPSDTTTPSIQKLKPVTSRKTVTFKIPIHEDANVKNMPSIHFPGLEEYSNDDNLSTNDVNHDLKTKDLKRNLSLECLATQMINSPGSNSKLFPSPRTSPIQRSNEPNGMKLNNQSLVKTVLRKNQYSPYIRQIRKRKSKIIHKYGRSFSSKSPVWVTSEPACSTSWIDIRETASSKGERSMDPSKEKYYSPHGNSSYDNSISSSDHPSKKTNKPLSEKITVSPALSSDTKRPFSRNLRNSKRGTNGSDPLSPAKSPTRLSNIVDSSQEATGRAQNNYSHGNNCSGNFSASVDESQQNKRLATEMSLKRSFKRCSGAHSPGPLKDGSISDAIWDEYRKLSSTISKPLRDTIFKECGLKPPFSDSTLVNNIGDNGFQDVKHPISSPAPPQSLRAIGNENPPATRSVSSTGTRNSSRKAIIFSGRPVRAVQTGHQPSVTKGTSQKTSKYSQDDFHRKKYQFINERQYELPKELQCASRERKYRAGPHYDSFEIPLLLPSMSQFIDDSPPRIRSQTIECSEDDIFA